MALVSRSLSLSRSRARAHSCSKAHLHLCPRGHHWHPNLLEWCPAVTLCHRLFPSPALSLCLCLCPSLFQVCLRLVLPGARRTARSNTCHAGLARSPVGAAPAQQAVQRCARTAGCATLLSHATKTASSTKTSANSVAVALQLLFRWASAAHPRQATHLVLHDSVAGPWPIHPSRGKDVNAEGGGLWRGGGSLTPGLAKRS